MLWFDKNPAQPARITTDDGSARTSVRILPAKDPSGPAYTKTLPGEICDDAEIRRRQAERQRRG